MKYSQIFQNRISCSDSEAVFSYLISNLKNTITKWDYFVNWTKVYTHLKEVEIDLNILNYLIGKENVEEELRYLLKKNPSIYRLIPILIACRQEDFTILIKYNRDGFEYKNYKFKYDLKSNGELTDKEISDYVEFARDTGFLQLIADKKIKSLVDYVIGVEVGLDSNGRKNRGGDIMEDVLEFFVEDICRRNSIEYIKQADALKIKKKWGIVLSTDISSRIIDFALFNKMKLILIETNFYSGGGSKLKATAGEYITMYNYWKKAGYDFIWITDGDGWRTTKNPLKETFDQTDYILNLEMVSKGILEDIIKIIN